MYFLFERYYICYTIGIIEKMSIICYNMKMQNNFIQTNVRIFILKELVLLIKK